MCTANPAHQHNNTPPTGALELWFGASKAVTKQEQQEDSQKALKRWMCTANPERQHNNTARSGAMVRGEQIGDGRGAKRRLAESILRRPQTYQLGRLGHLARPVLPNPPISSIYFR